MAKIDKEQQKAFQKSLDWLNGKQKFMLFWWSIFSERRAIKYTKRLQDGMSAIAAFREAKNMK